MNEFHDQYQKEYGEFINGYQKTQYDGEDVGALIAKMAHQYAQHNTLLIDLQTKKDKMMVDILSTVEGSKPISVSKAEMLLKVSLEYIEAEKMEAHIKNIEQYINALKSLQKGLLNEYAHSKNIQMKNIMNF